MNKHICRTKRIDNLQWITGYFVQCDGEINHGRAFIIPEVTGICYIPDNTRLDGFIEVFPNTVCQCTGWCDSNKTPIFEKDIVEFVGANTHRDLVWWSNEMSMMDAVSLDGIKFNGCDYWNDKYPKYSYSNFCLMMQDPWGVFKEIRVIGNIIDNPELLEV